YMVGIMSPRLLEVGRPVMKPRRQIDEPIEGFVADVEIQRRDGVTLGPETFADGLEVLLLEQNRRPVVDGLGVIREIEFRRVDRDAAGTQDRQTIFEEPQPLLDRS